MTRLEEKTTQGATMIASSTVRESCAVAIADLKEHPHRDHVRTDADAKEMAASIAQHGLIEPLLVQKSTNTIIAGHRRKWGLEVLGSTTARAELIDVPDDVALVLLQVSNNHRERPDPMKESESVAALLALPGWNVQRAAEALRVKPQWVARRANLRNLAPEIEKLTKAGKPLERWPVEWLEQVAILAKDAQAAFAKHWSGASYAWPRIEVQKDLEMLLADEVQLLGKAPFDIHDPQLVPRAGACVSVTGGSSCKKTTIARPGLFDDEHAGDVKTARCCDAPCWAGKVKAHIDAEVAAARAAHGKDLVVVEPRGSYGEGVRKALTSTNHLPSWQVEVVKGGTKGAKPALQVEQDGSVAAVFVRGPESARGSSTSRTRAAAGEKKEDTRSPAQRLKDSQAGILDRRHAHVVDAVREWLEKKTNDGTFPSWKDLRELLVRFKTGAEHKYEDGRVKTNLAEVAAIAADDLRLVRDLWPRLRDDVVERLKRWGGNANLAPKYQLALWVAPKLGLVVEHLEGDAWDDVPDPKWWPDTARTTNPRAALLKKSKTAPATPADSAPPKGATKKKPARAAAAKGTTKKAKR